MFYMTQAGVGRLNQVSNILRLKISQPIFLELGRCIRKNSLTCHLLSELSSLRCCHTQGPANELHAPQTVIVGGDWIGYPRRIGVGVDDPDRRDVVQPAFVQHHPVLQRVQANHQIWSQHCSLLQLVLESRNLSIKLIDNFR